MPQQIGSAITGLTNFNVNTQMPALTDNADIQEALRLYHYGAPSGTGVGQYDPTNTNPSNLVNPSIAHSLYSLQTQITNVSGSLGVQASTWTSKGALVSATAASSVQVLTLPSQSSANDGFVLTINYAGSSTGLNWASPSVTPTNTVTFTNKTLTAPKITASSFIADTNGNSLISFPALVTSAVNQITVTNAATTGKPTISATGTDTNITLNLVSKGTGTVQVNGVDIDTVSGTSTLTNKTLTSPTINGGTISNATISSPSVSGLYLSDSNIIFEGITNDAFETTLGVIDPTADRTINLPNVDGTVITTGNLSSITTVGTVTAGSFPAANLTGTALASNITSGSITSLPSLNTVGTITTGSFPAANLSGTTLASNVVSSSLTSVGAITSGSFPAANLSGTSLAANVVSSSLTSVGTLTNLTVTNPINGSITGTAGSISAANITGTTLASNVVSSSLTSVGTLTNLSVTNTINGSINGTAGFVSGANVTGTVLASNIVSSSLTSVGTLANLTVTNPINGSITGSAGSVAAANITGTSLPTTIVSSSLTSVGTLTNLTVTNPISGSVTGSAGSVAAANITGTTLPAAIVSSSLTSVGTLSSLSISGDLTVTGKILDRISINSQISISNYNVVASDYSRMIEMDNPSANTVTVPNLSTIPVGAQIAILQVGAGQTTIVAGTNVVINGTPGLKLRAQWSGATLIKRSTGATDVWVALGDLVA